ncbi:hypothetical protein B0H11DRAFT_1918525 [Mycena galericulata]|nr:hypothetical protein B0H11DRAFT_1918525 [Mycena galericulata]
MSSSLTASLSLDLCCRIFHTALYEDSEMSCEEIVDTRVKICRSSSVWMRIMLGLPTIWSFVFVGLTRPLEAALYAVNLSASSPLRFHFDFVDFAGYFEESMDASCVADLVERMIRPMLPFFHRVVDVRMDVDDALVLDIARTLFADVRAPMLRRFVLRVMDTYAASVPERPWGRGWSTSLETLHLRSAPISFAGASFGCLRVLRLFGILHPAMSYDMLRSIIASSPSLSDVAFHMVSCVILPGAVLLPVVSDSITSLDMSFNEATNFALVASLFRFPSLRSLRFDTTSLAHIEGVPGFAHLFVGVSHLVLTERRLALPLEQALSLFFAFPAVETLDLSCSKGFLFEQIVIAATAARTDGPHLPFPALSCILLGHESLELVMRLANRYSRLRQAVTVNKLAISLLRLPEFKSELDDLAEAWLISNVPAFTQSYEPPRHRVTREADVDRFPSGLPKRTVPHDSPEASLVPGAWVYFTAEYAARRCGFASVEEFTADNERKSAVASSLGSRRSNRVGRDSQSDLRRSKRTLLSDPEADSIGQRTRRRRIGISLPDPYVSVALVPTCPPSPLSPLPPSPSFSGPDLFTGQASSPSAEPPVLSIVSAAPMPASSPYPLSPLSPLSATLSPSSVPDLLAVEASSLSAVEPVLSIWTGAPAISSSAVNACTPVPWTCVALLQCNVLVARTLIVIREEGRLSFLDQFLKDIRSFRSDFACSQSSDLPTSCYALSSIFESPIPFPVVTHRPFQRLQMLRWHPLELSLLLSSWRYLDSVLLYLGHIPRGQLVLFLRFTNTLPLYYIFRVLFSSPPNVTCVALFVVLVSPPIGMTATAFSDRFMPATVDTDRFGSDCKVFLRDETRYAQWFASAGVCSRCAVGTDAAACVRLPGTRGCNPCVLKKIKCPHQENYLFDQTKAVYYPVRSDFDASRTVIKSRRPRPSRFVGASVLPELLSVPSAVSRTSASDIIAPVTPTSADNLLTLHVEHRADAEEGNHPSVSLLGPVVGPTICSDIPSSVPLKDFLSSISVDDLTALDKDGLLALVVPLVHRVKQLEDFRRLCVEHVALCNFRLVVAHKVTKLRLASPPSPSDSLSHYAELLLAGMWDDTDNALASLTGSLDLIFEAVDSLSSCVCFRITFRSSNKPSSFREHQNLQYTCFLWFDIVHSTHAFWSSIRVNRTQSITHIEYLLDKSARGTIHLALRLDEAPVPRFPSVDPSIDHNPPIAFIVNTLLPHFSRAVSLAIFPGNTNTLMMMRHHLHLLTLPIAETIVVHRDSSVPDVYAPSPRVLLPALSHSLRCLDLCVLAIDLSTLSPLPNVECVVLRAVRKRESPRWSNLLLFLRALPSLRFLSLDGVGCSSVPLTIPSLDILPALQVLQLSFKSNGSLRALLCALRFPSLHSLYFSAESVRDFSHLGACPSLLGRVQHLYIDGHVPLTSAVVPIVPLIHSVREIHAPYAGSVLLDAMRVSVSPAFASLPLPKLEILGLGPSSPSHVLPFVLWSSDAALASHLRRLVLWTSLPLNDLPVDPALPLLDAILDVDIRVAYPVAAWRFRDIASPFVFSSR